MSILNTKFRAILKRFGFNVTGGDIWYRSDDKDWKELQTKWNVINSISDKLPVDDDYIYEEFDIPKPDNYEELKEELRIKTSFNPFESGLQNPLNVKTHNGASHQHLVNNSGMSLWERIHRFFVQSPGRMGELNGKARTLTNQNNLNEALALRVWNGETEDWDTELFFFIADNLLSALDKSFVNPQLGAFNQIAYDAPDGYSLVWNDEFDTGNELNSEYWTHEVKNAGWVNHELQNYVNHITPGGSYVTELRDGKLRITCLKEDGKIYSARVYAKLREGWTYGYIEASIKLPKGKGTWPAFWMMPVNFTAWPDDGEIDIMEEVGYHPNYRASMPSPTGIPTALK